MAGLHFEITGDNKSVINALNETERKIKSVSSSVEKEGGNIDRMFERIKQSAAMFAAGFTTKELVMNIVNVRGEFQKLSVAFETMLGSKEKADSLMKQMVETAATTPFGLQDVAGGAKQLLAYGVAAEDVNETLIRLGDIAAGLSIPLGDLVYLYGTTRAQGRLYTEDFNQFTSRGIPMIEMLAEKFGVAENEVKGLVEAGKVGFPEVQEVIENLTNEGGKFGGLMEAQSKTISGQISNIEDAFETMFNEIGKHNEGVINTALSSVSYLVEHWEAVAAAIESAAIAYGTYKAAVMTTAALQGAESTLKIDTEIAGLKKLLGVTEEVKNADLAAAVASGRLSEAKAAEVVSLRENLSVKISTLEAEKLMAEQEYANAAANLASSQKRLKAAEDAVDGIDDWIARAEELGDTELANRYRVELGQKSIELQNASIAKNSAEKALNAAATRSKSATEALNTVTVQANTVANNANAASMNIMKLAAIQLSNIMKSLWATLMANPLLLVAGAAAGLAYAVYKVATAETEAEKIERRYSEAVSDATKKLEERRKSIEELIRKIEDNNTAEGERIKAFESLKAAYPEIFDKYATEEEYLKNIAEYKKRIAEEDSRRAGQGDEENLRLLQNQLNYLRNRKAEGINLVDLDGNGWATDDVDEAIKAQLEIINKAKAKIGDTATASFLSTIKDLDDSRISEVLDGIANSLRAIGNSGDNAIAIVSELGGEFSKSQLKTIKNALETELEERSGEKLSPESWMEVYKKEYLSAKKALEDFMNSESSLSEKDYKETFKKLTEAKDEAEKKYKQAGGKVDTESSINKAKKEAEQIKKEQEQLADDLLHLRFKNQQDEINLMKEGSDKKRRQIELDYQKEIDAYNKVKAKYGETDEIKAMKLNAETKRSSGLAAINEEEQKKEQERIKAQEDAWNEALIKFGDYNQKRKAIIEKYDKEIAQAQNAGEEWVKTEEKKAALEELDEQYGKSTRVMADLFENAGEKSVTAIQKIIDKYETLVKYLSGTEQSDGTPVTLDELKAIGFTDKDIESIERGEISIRDLTDALKNLNGELEGKSPWMSFVNDMQKSIGKIKSAKGETEKIGEGVMGIGNAVTDFAPALGEFAENIGSIFGVDGEKIQGIVGSIQGLGQTATGVGQILSGDIVGGAMSAVGGISKVVSSLDNLFGADYSEYENMKAQYDTLISVWDTLIGKKTEYIDIDYGAEAQKAADEAIRLTETQIERQRQLANMLAGSGASVGSHSLGYRVNDRMSSQDWRRLSGLVGQQVGSLGDVLSLDADVIGKVLQDEKFVSVLTEVNSEFIDYISNIESYAEQLEDIAEKEKEALTGVSLDDFRNGYADLLSDLDSDNQDFADDFEKYLQNAIFSSLVANKYKERIEKLYNQWADYADSGGKLTGDEAEQLRNDYQDIVDDMLAEREQIMKEFGWSSSSSSGQQSASGKGFETMSQDSADELNGRFTALYEVGLQILQYMTYMQNITVCVDSCCSILSEMRELAIIGNSYLEDISLYSKKINECITKKLDEINNNLKNIL